MAIFKVNDRQTLFNIHGEAECRPPCVIHSPLDGPWRKWPLIWRHADMIDEVFGTSQGFERMCPCGVGHPAAEDYFRRGYDELMHGCCGVHICTPDMALEES